MPASEEEVRRIEAEVEELSKITVVDAKLKAAVDKIVESLPPPEKEVGNPDMRVRLLLLRCKARMLLPAASVDAEKDLQAALKLRQNNVDAWVDLSECFFRRNAFKDACEALDSALKIEPNHVPALLKYSQVQRNRRSEANLTNVQKTDYLRDSMAKAHTAVRVDMSNGEAWHYYALAVLADAMTEGIDSKRVAKALAAMNQAAAKLPNDPDVQYNKGALESLLGHYGDAAKAFLTAQTLDPVRLKGTKKSISDCVAVLERAKTRMKNAADLGKREFQALRERLMTGRNAGLLSQLGTTGATVGVVDVISEADAQPLAVLVADANGTFAIWMLYAVKYNALKICDTVLLPPSFSGTTHTHQIPAVPSMYTDAVELTILQIHGDARDAKVNGAPLPAKAFTATTLSSRLFI